MSLLHILKKESNSTDNIIIRKNERSGSLQKQRKQPQGKAMKSKLLKFPFPLVMVIVYIFIGVLFHKWHPTWLLFLLIPAYYEIVNGIGKINDEKTTYQILKIVPITSIAIILYLIMGFAIHLWHPGWLIFLLIPLYYAIIPLFKSNGER